MTSTENKTNNDERFVRVEAVAEFTGLSTSTLYRWAEKNIIPSYKIGGRARLFKLSEVRDRITSFSGTTVVSKEGIA